MGRKIIVLLVAASLCSHAFSQNIGIGTPAPKSKLQVAGNLIVSEPEVYPVLPPSKQIIMVDGSNLAFSSTDSSGILYDPSGPSGLYSQNITAYSQISQGTGSQASDVRLKKNINPLTGALQKINELGGYHYNWINPASDSGVQTGLLAQEVKAVMPELVKSDDMGELSGNYNGMIPYFVEAVKELKKQNNNLQNQIDLLKKKKK